MEPFLSLCMIVRNEGGLLERCLSSAAPHVDEIVIMDTGSIDDTKAIAFRFTRQVYDYPWSDDFASARNAAVQKTTGDWILILDADEYLDVPDLSDLRAFLSRQPELTPVGIILPIYNFVGSADSGNVSESKAMRIFNRHPDFYFARPIHEHLLSRSGKMTELEFPLPVYHTGYTEDTIASKRKNERNQAILNQMRAEGKFSPYDSFLMGNEYYSQDRYEEALLHYREADQTSERDKTWLPSCIGNLVNCLIKLGQFTEAYLRIRQACGQWPHTCDFFWLEGYLLALLGFDEQAIRALRECLRIANLPSGRQNWLISPNHATTLPLQQLAVLYLRQFDFQEAVSCLTPLAYARPNHQAFLVQLLKLIRSEDVARIASLLNSIYPAPEPHQAVMIGEACMQAGLTELSERYGDIEFPRQPELRDHNDLSAVAEYCMFLFRSGSYDEFDAVLQKYNDDDASLFLAQSIGDAFFREGQFDLALDYYSLLLKKDKLSGTGFENLARLYFMQGEREEGSEFLSRAIGLLPDRIELYTLFILHNGLQKPDSIKIADELYARFPGLRDFPLWPR